jgi:hypothetical protein
MPQKHLMMGRERAGFATLQIQSLTLPKKKKGFLGNLPKLLFCQKEVVFYFPQARLNEALGRRFRVHGVSSVPVRR